MPLGLRSLSNRRPIQADVSDAVGWRRLTLGDLGVVQSGFAFRSGDWVEVGVPVVKIQNVRRGRINLDGCSFVSQDVAGAADRYRISDGDVLITMSGEIGSVGIVRTSEHLMLNQRVGRIRLHDEDPILLRFLGYSLQLPELKKTMESIAYGAAQANISPSLLASLPIHLPVKRSQVVVNEILGTIDDLIDNCRLRIELLARLAEIVYREWFIQFRYPGYERGAIIESEVGPIPAGWEVQRLGDVADLSGGSSLTKASYTKTGFVAYSAAGPDGYLPDYEEDGKGVVLSAVGARCGRTFRASGRWSSIANTIRLLPSVSRCVPSWLYLVTSNPHAWPRRGSAQPFISINDARAIPVVLPDQDTADAFEAAIGGHYEVIDLLKESANELGNLRNHILPELVTGRLDVSELELGGVESM